MQMTGQRVLPVPPQQAWNALNDPEMLKACIPGCESIVQTGPDQFEVLMAARIGPVTAKFKGKLAQSDVVEPQSYKIAFDGQGGVAGFGKGSAVVRLSPVDAGTQLDYDVNAQVGGKIAQIGSRLVDAAAAKIADEFFGAFETKLTEQNAAQAAAATSAAAPAATTAAVSGPVQASAGHAAASDHGIPASHGAHDEHGGHGHAATAPAGTSHVPADTSGWLIGGLVLVAAAALIGFLVR